MVSGGGTNSAPSSCSSWTAWIEGDVALGGSSLREFLPPGDVAGRVGTLAGLLFLKTRGLPESSLSEFISNTLFPLSGRAGTCVDAAARGTAAMGGGEVGVWQVWGENSGVSREVTGAGGVMGDTSRAAEPHLLWWFLPSSGTWRVRGASKKPSPNLRKS